MLNNILNDVCNTLAKWEVGRKQKKVENLSGMDKSTKLYAKEMYELYNKTHTFSSLKVSFIHKKCQKSPEKSTCKDRCMPDCKLSNFNFLLFVAVIHLKNFSGKCLLGDIMIVWIVSKGSSVFNWLV